MGLILLPVTLTSVGAAAFISLWLGVRIIMMRRAGRVNIGDGGDARIAARMRAQLNFAEYAPVILILIAVIELATGTSWWLWIAGGLFIIARILHPFGMDGWIPGRMIGTILTLVLLIALGATAIAIPFLAQPTPPQVEIVSIG